MRPLNNWILDKIATYLASKQGCEVEGVNTKDNDNTSIVLKDAFGFRYEVKVTALSRVDNDDGNEGSYHEGTQKLFKGNFFSLIKII